MAKTIKQYAEEFADAMVKGALGTRNDYYDSYIKGTIDQRKRDVELFGEWIIANKPYCFEIEDINEFRRVMEDKQ